MTKPPSNQSRHRLPTPGAHGVLRELGLAGIGAGCAVLTAGVMQVVVPVSVEGAMIRLTAAFVAFRFLYAPEIQLSMALRYPIGAGVYVGVALLMEVIVRIG